MEKFDDYLINELADEKVAEEYINSALEEFFKDNNKALFLSSLNDVVRARGGISSLAKSTQLNRQHLYKILSSKGNPTLEKIGAVIKALGLKFRVKSI